MRNWLKKMRIERKLSQSEVAAMLGVAQQYYSAIEQGKRQGDLSLSLACKIADVFRISIEDIIIYEKIRGK